MPYQYVREPLTAEEADCLANARESPTEQLIVWTLLDTGLRVGELCALTSKDILWQQRQLRVRGKGEENNQPRILLGTFRQDTSLRTSSWIARFPQTWHPATSGVFCGEESAMQAVRMLLDRQEFRATTIVPSDAPDLVRGHVSLPVARGVPGLSSPAVGRR